MIKKIKRRIKSNSGLAVTVFGMWVLAVLCLTGIFLIDISKNVVLRNWQQHITEQAAKTATKSQTGKGGLTALSMDNFLKEYRKLYHHGKDESNRTYCQQQGNYPKITIQYYPTLASMAKPEYGNAIGIDKFNITGYASSGLSATAQQNFMRNQNARGGYKIFKVTVEDSVGNVALGVIGKPCSTIKTTSTVIASSAYNDENT